MNHLFIHDWSKMLFPALPWAEKVVRPLVVYLFLLGAFRVSGKRELGQATLFEFLIILLISNVVQNAIIGDDNSILGAFAGVITLLVLSFILNKATSNSRKARRVLEGMHALLIYHGKVLDAQMKKESVAKNDLYMALRKQGIASVADVRYAIIELDGDISIIKTDAGKPKSKEDCVLAAVLESSPVDVVKQHLQAAGVNRA